MLTSSIVPAESRDGAPAPVAPYTPRKGQRGVGMILKLQDAREKPASFWQASLPQEFVVKELLAGSAAECGQIACGDRVIAIDGRKVANLSLQQV